MLLTGGRIDTLDRANRVVDTVLTCPVAEIKDIHAMLTMVGGEVVHSSGLLSTGRG